METLDINKNLIQPVYKNEVLLPDFQRDFVWSEEKQIKLVSSLLAKLPIGSFLLFPGTSDEYKSKKLGNKKLSVTFAEDKKDVQYLLDGQQRLTALTNVLSNRIYDNNDIKDVYPELKRRFFLKLELTEFGDDDFGCEKLIFPFDPEGTPDFLPSDIKSRIHTVQLKDANTGDIYHPENDMYEKQSNAYLDAMSTIGAQSGNEFQSNYFYIPLFMICEPNFVMSRYLRKYADYRTQSISNIYLKQSKDNAISYLKDFDKFDDTYKKLLKEDNNLFIEQLRHQGDIWTEDMNRYLKSCVEKSISNIILPSKTKADRARAISIYENLNMGGVSLSTFDLIIAKAANCQDGNIINLQEELTKNMQMSLGRPKYLHSQQKYPLTWNASDYVDVLDKNDRLKSKTINIFLNVLSLISYIDDRTNSDLVKSEYVKKDKILELKSESIRDNYASACKGINRGLQFLQFKCGLRSIGEVNYEHILTIISFLMIDDKIYDDEEHCKIIDGWYWSAIFSGEFNSDQNTKLENNLKLLINLIYNKKGKSIIKEMKNSIFTLKNFSDENTLLMLTAITPKTVLKTAICQFVLRNGVYDLYNDDDDQKIYSWDSHECKFEYHHIIPLGTFNAGSDYKISISTEKLRKNTTHILNSPINFVLISSKANKEISDSPLTYYLETIKDYAHRDSYIIDIDVSEKATYDNDTSKQALSNRFEKLKGRIKSHIDNCLENTNLYED